MVYLIPSFLEHSLQINKLTVFFCFILLQAIIIWDAKTGAKKRGFLASGGHWPVFK